MKPSYILAEIGVNHSGSTELALEMIHTAAKAGANGVKFQCYKAESLAAKSSPAYWDRSKEKAESQYTLFKKLESADLNFYRPLIDACKLNNIDFVATCFDKKLVDIFDPYLPYHKISSSDITNIPLINHIISKNKPIVLSTGASTIEEIIGTVSYIRERTKVNLTILHCVLNYPCLIQNANISMISKLKSSLKTFKVDIGYSCHVAIPDGIDCVLAAITSGAIFIEKHYTTSRIKEGNDHYHAMTAEDLVILREKEKKLIKLLGTGEPDIKAQREARINARRGLYLAKDLAKDSTLQIDDIVILRPTNTLSPGDLSKVIGKAVKTDLKKGSPLSLDMLK